MSRFVCWGPFNGAAMVSFEQLIQNLKDTSQPSIVRSSAIADLASQGGLHSTAILTEVLADPDSMIRREAATALLQLNATEAAAPLLAALQVESNDLTLWAMLEAVGELATPDAIPVLESLRAAGSMLTRIEIKKSVSRIQARDANGEPVSREVKIETQAADMPIHADPEPAVFSPDESADAQTGFSHTDGDAAAYAENSDPINRDADPDPIREAAFDAGSSDADEDAGFEQPRVRIEAVFASPPTDPDRREAARIDEEETHDSDTPTYTDTHQTVAVEIDEEEFGAAAEESDAELAADAPYYEPAFDEPDEEVEMPRVGGTTDTPYYEVPPEAATEPSEDLSPDAEARPRDKESQAIDDLAASIAGSTRLAGSSANLPVLVPNAATVPYHPTGTMLEPVPDNFFLALIHPRKYLSKQWLQRTRVYLILWAVLVIGTIGFTQYQRHTKTESSLFSRFGVSMSDLPELVKRSLAEGDFYIQEGYYRKAISSYELSKGLGGLPFSFQRKLGFAYFKEGQYALAVEAYESFLKAKAEENPDVFAAEASLIGVSPLTSLGDRTTRDYETYNILGTAYRKLGRVLDAQRAYEKAIRLAPKYGEAYHNLARLYADDYPDPLRVTVNEPTGATHLLQTSRSLRFAETLAYTAVTLNPDVAAYHNTLGWVLAKRGQVNRAMKALERAIDLQGDAIEPHYHLAQVALKADQREKAATAIRNVFKLDPTFISMK